jgi:hypothetical protein
MRVERITVLELEAGDRIRSPYTQRQVVVKRIEQPVLGMYRIYISDYHFDVHDDYPIRRTEKASTPQPQAPTPQPQVPAVDWPDSASHYYCAVRVKRLGGYGPNRTHHMVNGVCTYCLSTETDIRKEAGL